MKSPTVPTHADVIYADLRHRLHGRTDRLVAVLLLLQWAGTVAWALVSTPYTWSGEVPSLHPHVWAAVLLGALIALPAAFISQQFSGAVVTRHVNAVAQMLASALLVHISGGRIENPLSRLRVAGNPVVLP